MSTTEPERKGSGRVANLFNNLIRRRKGRWEEMKMIFIWKIKLFLHIPPFSSRSNSGTNNNMEISSPSLDISSPYNTVHRLHAGKILIINHY
jgi:hypothetical protein